MDEDELTEGELTADDVLTFGPVVEAVTWTPIWLQEARAPIAVAAGRAKLGPIFNSDGVGKAVVIRPCISRGRRIRGLSPIYTPKMLEANAGVFDGWPMFMDHVPPELVATMAKAGRSVKELGGQIVKGHWSRDFLHESDAEFGYQKGGVLAEIWATPFIRNTVGQNPNLLHTSINAWPKSGKPGPVPWRPGTKGMIIEGIRRQPQGSVDFVVRGGAGGRLLVQEGLEEEGAWPETGEWSSEDVALVVCVAESLYASAEMKDLPTKPDELKAYLQENAPHLLPALTELDSEDKPLIEALMKRGKSRKQAEAIVAGSKEERSEESEAITIADVRTIVESLQEGAPSVEEFERQMQESVEQTLAERDAQRHLANVAAQLIESAEGLPPTWKADLKARYSMLPSGPSPSLLVEATTDDAGEEVSAEAVLKEAVTADLDHARGLIADAKGKPRVTGEGAAKPDAASGERSGKAQESTPYWRERFVSMRIAESEEQAVEVYGGTVATKEDK